MKTIIAEKPSVAREIARIVGATKREEGYFEGGGYAVTWAFGHLVQLAMPDGYGIRGFVRDNLPVIPETFTLIPRQEKTEKGYKPDSGVVSQIKIIARLFKESEQIIVATDAGREGELIFRYLYHYIGCTTPFVRLWISSLTDKAIREGLRNLEAGDKYDNLYLAAKARSESDWLVGINGTQALSIAAGHGTYSVGRVQTPTLAMVCARYWENRRFTVEPFWQLHIAADTGDGEVVKLSSSKKWKEKEPATALYNKVKEAGFATVTKAERKEKIEETPLLYDLTTLQKEANDKRVAADLEIAQKQNELKLKQAALKQEADIAQAKADAAKGIEAEVQRREQERVAAEANIMKQEKEAEVKEREVKVREQELDANIRKQAEAEKYARQQAAEAELIERQRKAEAELFETQKEAEARKAQAEAEKFAQLQEAEAIEAKGRAEAEAIRLKLEAEAKGLDQKAEAMKKMQEAAITEMVVDKLPEIARAVAEPLTKVDKITMYGEGNASKMVGDIMQSIDQVSQGAGFDIRQLLAGALGVNMTVNKLKEGEQPVIEADELASKED